MTIFLTAPSLISGFQFLVEKKPTTAVVSDIFAADLNGDGVQEAIFVGRQTQPATISTWSNSTIHIFQVNASGAWVETTNSLMPDNVIQGSEPNCLVGDFNNDAKVDFFVPSDTDMQYLVPSYLFLNTGSSFTKHAFDFQTWAHGAFVADVNKDGYLDVLSTDYGSRTGIGFGTLRGFDYKSTDWRGTFGGSGICAADFLGDGSVTILVSDDGAVKGAAALYKWRVDTAGKLIFVLHSSLPAPRFEQLSKWTPYKFGDGAPASHDIRIVPFDFSGDGLIDAIGMSRPWLTNGTWPEYSEIQFLLNKGNGVFEDVTDSKLVGYNNSTAVSYQPIFLDVNRDGRTDIFISSSDFSNYNSTAVLLQQANGAFVETGRDTFSNLYKSAVANVKSANLGYVFTVWGQPMQLAEGVNGKITVLGSVCYQNAQGGMSNMVFGSDLSFGNISFDETITGSVGNDTLNGGAGIDTVVYAGNRSNYTLTKGASSYTVTDKTGSDGTDTLTNIERLVFADFKEALGTTALNESEVQKLYIAYFNRPGDPGGLGYWEGLLANGASMTMLQNSFSSSAEYQAIYIGQQNTVLITKLYQNLFGRVVDVNDGGVQWWAGEMDAGRHTITTIAGALSSGTTPGSADNIAITNKITAATAFTNALNTNAETENYVGTAAFAIASNWLAPIRDDNILATSLASRDATITSAVAAKTVLVNATGTANASQGVVTFELAATSFDYTISGFGVGDRIDFPTGAVPTLTNASYSDGQVNLIWSAGGNNVLIKLVGLSGTQDSQLNTLADFSTVFGSGSVY